MSASLSQNKHQWRMILTIQFRFEQEQTKVCFKCHEDLPLTSFYKHPQMKDGRVNKCKECNKADNLKHRHDNVERIREYDRKRSKDPNRIAALTECNKRYRALNPVKYQAHMALNNALRKGHLVRPENCSECNKVGTIHGHHDDYRKPLEVRWLCAVCHSDWHQKNGEGLQ